MMGGLIAATILTLKFLPALYALAWHADARSNDQTHGEPSEASRLIAAA